jgi:hypothetical protein
MLGGYLSVFAELAGCELLLCCLPTGLSGAVAWACVESVGVVVGVVRAYAAQLIRINYEQYKNYQLDLSHIVRYLAFKHAGMSPQKFSNYKEDIMRAHTLLTVGFFALVAAFTLVSASNSFAAEAQRVDVIDKLPAEAQWDSAKTDEAKVQRVDVIDHVNGGPVYPSTTGAMRVDVIDSTRS